MQRHFHIIIIRLVSKGVSQIIGATNSSCFIFASVLECKLDIILKHFRMQNFRLSILVLTDDLISLILYKSF